MTTKRKREAGGFGKWVTTVYYAKLRRIAILILAIPFGLGVFVGYLIWGTAL